MASPLTFDEYLSAIQRCLNLKMEGGSSQNFRHEMQSLKDQLFNCQDNFYGDVKRNILLTKIRVDQVLQKSKGQSLAEVAVPERNTMLSSLNCDIDLLMKEGLLTLYMDLCDLRAKASKLKIRKELEKLLRAIIENITNLLRIFFTYQEYHNRKSQESRRKKNILSLRNLNDTSRSSSSEFDPALLKEIEGSLSSSPVSELLEAYLNKEEEKINETMEVCRICSYKIKIENMERHVRNCQKKSLLKQKIEEKTMQLCQLMEDLKSEVSLISEKAERNKEEEGFRVVAKLILSDKRKERSKIRRSSLTGVRSQKSIKAKIQHYIEEYECQNGEHFILHKILLNCQERDYLEKRICAIEINSDHNQSVEDIEKSKASQEPSFRLVNRTSLEDEPSFLCKSSSMLEPLENDKVLVSNSSNVSLGQLREICKTKKSIKKVSEPEYQTVFRHYVSLQDIVLEDQEADTTQVSLQKFEFLKFLGQGAFGKVYLVRRKETGDNYALKVVRISDYSNAKELETIRNEHQIFKKIAGDHLVKAPFSFSEKESHIFVLEYLPGGDLRKMLDDEVYFEEGKAQFYLAEIVLAIEHLHKSEIIHRDLKPENLVIDKDGHLKLTDFGLSELRMKLKLEKSKLMSEEVKNIRRRRMRRSAGIWGNKGTVKLIGTPDYIAPEIISQISINNYTIDWWSLGVMTYEMLIGARPFSGESIEEIIDNITNFKIEWPEVGYGEGMISPEGKDLIQQLLNVDFVNRLGANGAQEIKDHPFFSGIDWSSLKNSRPPMVPRINKGQLREMKEDKALKAEVAELVGSSKRLNKKFNLQRFVRFDLLGFETMENAEKVYADKASRIERLKTIRRLELANECSELRIE